MTIQNKEKAMAKAYWVSVYKAVTDENKLAAYGKIAGPAIMAAGGRFLARGIPSQVYENGIKQRTVLIEFESLAAAIAAHDSAEYGKALAALEGGCEREIRIIEGAE